MSVTREDADALVDEWVKDPSLTAHLRSVSQVMRAAATTFGGQADEPEQWALAGLLHDADWEVDPEEHPNRVVDWLRLRGADDLARAIATHNSAWGAPVGAMAKCLLCFDELTGFIGAVAKVNPDGIEGTTSASVLKKLRKRGFAASVDRAEVEAGAAAIGLTVAEAAEFVLAVLRANPGEDSALIPTRN